MPVYVMIKTNVPLIAAAQLLVVSISILIVMIMMRIPMIIVMPVLDAYILNKVKDMAFN